MLNISTREREWSDIITTADPPSLICDALAAQVGGSGIAPGAYIGDGVAVFEATHGTAPNIAGKHLANPSSLILSAEMMLRHLGWSEAADVLLQAMAKAQALGLLENVGKKPP